jgi:hypothetical protein
MIPSTVLMGQLYLVAKYGVGCSLSKIATLFLVSYMLGMLVRYFPSQWTALLTGGSRDAALPTVLSAIELLEADFPRLVVEFLEER